MANFVRLFAVNIVLWYFGTVVSAQQYVGDVINSTLPSVPGSVLTYYKIKEPSNNTSVKLTLTNYMSLNSTGGRVDGPKVQRAVIVIHGLNRDPQTYMSNMLSALSQVSDPTVNFDSVAICAPYFPNGDDKNIGYPWTTGLSPGRGSTSSELVWSASLWASGANNQYPWNMTTVSSYEALDQLVRYFDNKTIFPNMKQIVVAGHSLGSQMVHRYASVGNVLNTISPVTYYVANPDSFLWFTADRPLTIPASCTTYDVWRDGLSSYSATIAYGASLVASGRAAVMARYNSRQIAHARGTLDLGNDASTCGAPTTGANRNERFFNYIARFPVTCTNGGVCSTIDYVVAGHDAGAMFSSLSGQTRLFLDNFNGTKKLAPDIGCPRLQAGDNPYPDPTLVGSCPLQTLPSGTYAGNMTYAGCWQDASGIALPYLAYNDPNNNTVDLCTSTCNTAGYTIAGVEYGSQCFCGNALAAYTVKTVDEGCSITCPANSTEVCGDMNRISIYSNGTPQVLIPPVTPAVVGGYNSIGCYIDNNPGRTLTAASTTSSNLTLESCAAFCSGYLYFGTEYSRECYCGNALSTGGSLTNVTDCSYLCTGNSTEYCGAGNRLTMYKLNSTLAASLPTSTSTTSAPTSLSTALACPAANNTTYTTTNGTTYLIQCYDDHAGGDLTQVYATSLLGCIQACDATTGCLAYSWVSTQNGVNNPCYLKSSIGADSYAAGVWGGKVVTAASSTSSVFSTTVSSSTTSLASASASSSSSSSASSLTSVSTSSTIATTTSAGSSSSSTASNAISTSTDIACPASNGVQFLATQGRVFQVECYNDHSGTDLSFAYATSLAGCIDICSNTTDCMSYSWVSTANGVNNPCYLKSTVGGDRTNSAVWGGKFVSNYLAPSSSVSSSSSAAAAASSTTTSLVSPSTSTSSTITSSATTSSTISSSTVASTSSSATASISTSVPTGVACPGSDGVVVTAPSGRNFQIQCYNDPSGADLTFGYVTSLAQCITLCDSNAQCVAYSWVSTENGPNNPCYLHSTVGGNRTNAGVWGGQVVASLSSPSVSSSSVSSTTVSSTSTSSTSISSTSASLTSTLSTSTSSSLIPSTSTSSSSTTTSASTSSSSTSSWTTSTSISASASAIPTVLACPSSDNAVYTGTNGQSFQVNCYNDHTGADLSWGYATTLINCINLCSTTSGCVAYSWVSSANGYNNPCYLKSTIGGDRTNNGVWGGKMLAAAPV